MPFLSFVCSWTAPLLFCKIALQCSQDLNPTEATTRNSSSDDSWNVSFAVLWCHRDSSIGRTLSPKQECQQTATILECFRTVCKHYFNILNLYSKTTSCKVLELLKHMLNCWSTVPWCSLEFSHPLAIPLWQGTLWRCVELFRPFSIMITWSDLWQFALLTTSKPGAA